MNNLSNSEIAEKIMNTKEYLSKEEYEFCFAHTNDVRLDTTYIGSYSTFGDYLNLRLYSEHDHEKNDYEKQSEEEWESNSLYCS